MLTLGLKMFLGFNIFLTKFTYIPIQVKLDSKNSLHGEVSIIVETANGATPERIFLTCTAQVPQLPGCDELSGPSQFCKPCRSGWGGTTCSSDVNTTTSVSGSACK